MFVVYARFKMGMKGKYKHPQKTLWEFWAQVLQKITWLRTFCFAMFSKRQRLSVIHDSWFCVTHSCVLLRNNPIFPNTQRLTKTTEGVRVSPDPSGYPSTPRLLSLPWPLTPFFSPSPSQLSAGTDRLTGGFETPPLSNRLCCLRNRL